jgi:hypothetical protein
MMRLAYNRGGWSIHDKSTAGAVGESQQPLQGVQPVSQTRRTTLYGKRMLVFLLWNWKLLQRLLIQKLKLFLCASPRNRCVDAPIEMGVPVHHIHGMDLELQISYTGIGEGGEAYTFELYVMLFP